LKNPYKPYEKLCLIDPKIVKNGTNFHEKDLKQ
jgi:hypothetical protein